MKHRYFDAFFLFLLLTLLIPSFSLNIFIYAPPENETLLHLDNQRKAAHLNELVQFNTTITNNKNNTETFIIRHAGENSILWFPMDTTMGDDNQNVYDSSPFGNHGTRYGALDVMGKVGKALSFNGVDDYVEVAREASLEPPHDMTILAWILLNDTSGWKPIVNHAYPNGYSFSVSGDQIYFCLRLATGYTSAYVSAGLVAMQRFSEAKYSEQQTRAEMEAEKARLGKMRKGPRIEDVTEAKANVRRARAALNFYKEKLALSFVLAPFDGIVMGVELEPGEALSMMTGSVGEMGIKLADVSTLFVKVDIPETSIAEVNKGAKSEIAVDAIGNINLLGVVDAISPIADRQSNTVEVSVQIKDPPSILRPGMSARVSILSNINGENSNE